MKKAMYLAAIIVLVSIVPVVAIEASDERTNEQTERSVEQKVEAIQAKQLEREQRQTQRCEIASGRLQSHAEKVDLIFEKRTSSYENIVERLKNLSARLENDEKDIAEVDVLITELSKRISDMDLTYGEYASANNFAINISCTDDGASVRAQIPVIRSAVKNIRLSDQQVRAYITDTIRPLVETIRDQYAEVPSDV